MTNEPNGAWEPIIDTRTTRAELEQVIDTYTRAALVDVLVQIAALDASPVERIAALVLVAPIIREQTARALTAGWLSLQGGPVH
jgi:hypothetical protein